MKALFLLTILLILIPTVDADYSIEWYTIDGGGGTSSGGPYQLTGTIGQPDADYLDGAPYELLGGFWVGGPVCIVNLEDFALFANQWLEPVCDEFNDDCQGADLDGFDGVDIKDLNIIAYEWLNVCPSNWPL